MVLVEVVVICLTIITVAIVAAVGAYFAIERRTFLQQQGIDRRTAAKLGGEGSTTSPYNPKLGFWENLALELVKNPQVVEMIKPYIPQLAEKFMKKEE